MPECSGSIAGPWLEFRAKNREIALLLSLNHGKRFCASEAGMIENAEKIGRITAILWDLDDTLARTGKAHSKMDELVCRLFGSAKAPSESFGRKIRGASIIDILIALSGASGISADVNQLFQAKLGLLPHYKSLVTPRPHALETWRWADNEGKKQGIVSSSPREFVTSFVRHLGIFEENLVIITAKEVENAKPHPEPFLKAADSLQVAPQECVVIEDSSKGAEAGLAAGMLVIGWQPHPEATFPEGTIVIPPDASPMETLIRLCSEDRKQQNTQTQTAIALRTEHRSDAQLSETHQDRSKRGRRSSL